MKGKHKRPIGVAPLAARGFRNHSSRGVLRFSPLALLAMLIGVVPAVAATVDLSIPVETIVWGPAGSQHVLAVVEVPVDSRGETCRVTAFAQNQDSEHPNSDLLISSDTSSIVIPNVESAAYGSVFGGGLITLTDTITVAVTLGPHGVFSGGLDVEIDCPPFNSTTTTNTSTETTVPPQDSAIGDLVWEDANADGHQGDFEVGVAGVTVNLLNHNGLVIATAVTNGTGNYLFAGLAAGTYEVQFVLPVGFEVSPLNAAADTVDSDAGVDLRTGAIILPSGVTDLTWDAGIYRTPKVLPQVISATTSTLPEALPFTGTPGRGLFQFGAALVAFGGLVVLALRRREEDMATAASGGPISRSDYHGKHRR